MNKLDELSEARSKLDLLRADMEKERQAVLDTIEPALCAVENRYNPDIAGASAEVDRLEDVIRDGVLKAGQTIKGTHLQAVYVKGRTSWDGAALNGYAAAHPEIERFRKVGDPSVTIRSV